LLRGRAEQLPSADGIFGAAVCECMLSLCPDPHAVLREIRRVLRPGGPLILTDVYARGPGDGRRMIKVSVQCCLQGAVNRAAVESRVGEAGFDLDLWEDHTPLLTQLAAQLVWTYGSLDEFWSALGRSDVTQNKQAAKKTCSSRPGYYLAIARKPY
jgi:arsenite methyltransferase